MSALIRARDGTREGGASLHPALRAAAATSFALAALVAGAGHAAPTNNVDPFAAAEYKLTLAASPRSDEERAAIWRAVFGKSDWESPVHQEIDRKKCRRIEFLDTADNSLLSSKLVLRRRTTLGDKKCQAEGAEEPEVTLKFRSKSPDEVRGHLAGSLFGRGSEAEKDLQIGRTAGRFAAVTAFSLSKEGQPRRSRISRTPGSPSLPFLRGARETLLWIPPAGCSSSSAGN